ncbi:polymer-forming cytoskeletal protein [bacterium]|nr:polymer-forming cytoskeletal protein [bacterium]
MKLPWKRYPKRRGAGILTVLVASTLLLLMAFTVAGTSFHHLSVSNRLHHSQSARNLAEAALAKAVAEIMYTNDKYQGTVTQDYADTESPNGLVAFNPANLAAINANLKTVRLEVSVNNFGSDAPITVSGRTLPGESAYLRAVGVDHGVERAMESLVYIPKFPWAIASGGKINISGNSRVGAFENEADVNDPTKELPGHLVANSTALTDALVLQGNQVTVTGDIQASGGADLGQNVVKGERRLHAQAATIPDIDIESYNPLGQTGCQSLSPGSQASNSISGLNHSAGNVDFSGGLTLDGGVLFVDGDITVNGQISGEGAIISKGKITIQGGGQVASNNKVAILSAGDLSLNGTSGDRLKISGVVYSEGKLSTDFTSILGNTVSPSTSGMDLKDTTLVAVDSALQITPPATPGGTDPELPDQYAFPAGTEPMALNVRGLNFTVPLTTEITRPMVGFLDPATGKYMLRRQTDAAWGDMIPNPGTPPPAYVQQSLGNGMYKTIETTDPTTGTLILKEVPAPTGSSPLTNADLRFTFGATVVNGDDPQLLSQAQTHAISVLNQDLSSLGQPPLTAGELTLVNAIVSTNFSGNRPVSKMANPLLKQQSAFINDKVPFGSNPPGTSGAPIFELNLNKDLHLSRYLSRAERMRVLYWRDVVQ